MTQIVWSIVPVALCAVLSILGRNNRPWLVYVFKPLTTVLIILVALLPEPALSQTYRLLIVTGLFFSLAGDVLLMLPDDNSGKRFLLGLSCFLCAHLFYVTGFGMANNWANDWTNNWAGEWHVLLVALVGLLPGYWLAIRYAGRMQWPAMIYMTALAAMFWQAGSWWLSSGQAAALLAGVGACLFVVSDSLLGVDRFVRSLNWRNRMVSSTYFAAQWLIALSVSI